MNDSIQSGSATLQLLVGVCVLATALFLVARGSGLFARADPSIPVPFANKEGQTMTMTALETVSAPAAHSAPPPIDLAVASKTETATFALG